MKPPSAILVFCTVTTLVSAGERHDVRRLGPSISADGRFVALVLAFDETGMGREMDEVIVLDESTGETTRVCESPCGDPPDGPSFHPAMSGDGSAVAFESAASNLVLGDANGAVDVFVTELRTRRTTRVSVGTSGVEANGASSSPAISADGRFVAFESVATRLVEGDANGVSDIFVRDRETSVTFRVSIADDDGEADGCSFQPSISADGRWVAFESTATRLVTGDTNGSCDVFVRDIATRRTLLASVDSRGVRAAGRSYGGVISADGRIVAFDSAAANLVTNDRNDRTDVFVHDLRSGETSLVSVGPNGEQGDDHGFVSSTSADGRFVAFESFAPRWASGPGCFVRDRLAGRTSTIGDDSDRVRSPALSGDGRVVVWRSASAGRRVSGAAGVPADTRRPTLADSFISRSPVPSSSPRSPSRFRPH
jgi:Tol biopolymer transport system component